MQINEEILCILKNIRLFDLQLRTGLLTESMKDKITFIEHCIDSLDAESKKIMRAIYYERVKITQLSKTLHLSRSGVYSRRNIIIKTIKPFFIQKFYEANNRH